jgi:hypothetical protein
VAGGKTAEWRIVDRLGGENDRGEGGKVGITGRVKGSDLNGRGRRRGRVRFSARDASDTLTVSVLPTGSDDAITGAFPCAPAVICVT